MNEQFISTAITGLLGGGVVASLLTYLRDRRKDSSDYTIATYKTLAEMNDRLKTEINEMKERHKTEIDELQKDLDTERRQRRGLEDRVAALERTQSH
jgi:hypothetical protein